MRRTTITPKEFESLMRTDVTDLITRTLVLLKMHGHPIAKEWDAVAVPIAVLTYVARVKAFEERKVVRRQS